MCPAKCRADSQVHFGLPELRVLGSDNPVAGQRELAATPQCVTVDERDDREWRGFESAHQGQRRQRKRSAFQRRHRAHGRDVGAGDKGLVARARDQQCAHTGVRAQQGEGGGQLGDDQWRERIEDLRTIDGQQVDAGFALFQQQRFEWHGASFVDE